MVTLNLITYRLRMEGQKMMLSTALIVVALILTVGSLVSGVISMAHGGDFDRRHSTQFMFARVGFQAATVLLLMLVLYLTQIRWVLQFHF